MKYFLFIQVQYPGDNILRKKVSSYLRQHHDRKLIESLDLFKRMEIISEAIEQLNKQHQECKPIPIDWCKNGIDQNRTDLQLTIPYLQLQILEVDAD